MGLLTRDLMHAGQRVGLAVVAIRAPAQLLNERVFRGEPRLVLRLQPVGDRGATIAPLVGKRSARQGEASPYAADPPTWGACLPPREPSCSPHVRPVGRTDAGPPMSEGVNPLHPRP